MAVLPSPYIRRRRGWRGAAAIGPLQKRRLLQLTALVLSAAALCYASWQSGIMATRLACPPVLPAAGSEQQQQQQQRLMLTAQGQLVAPTQQLPIPKDFKYNKVVTIIAWDRYNYFRQVVTALRRAWGSGEYLLSIFIDGPSKREANETWDEEGWKSVVQHSQQLKWMAGVGLGGFREVQVNVSETRIGVRPNKLRAVTYAFTLSDYVVVLEDDIIIDPDALRWFEWHVTSGLIFRRPEIGLSTCWSGAFPFDPTNVEAHDITAVNSLGLLDKFMLNNWATPWGWAMWGRTWDKIGGNWTGQDWKLGEAVQGQGWFETVPIVSRCNNIGSFGATRHGSTSGDIHERATTSASFSTAGNCQYKEIKREHPGKDVNYDSLFRNLRFGMWLDRKYENTTLEKYREDLNSWLAQGQDKDMYRSSC